MPSEDALLGVLSDGTLRLVKGTSLAADCLTAKDRAGLGGLNPVDLDVKPTCFSLCSMPVFLLSVSMAQQWPYTSIVLRARRIE